MLPFIGVVGHSTTSPFLINLIFPWDQDEAYYSRSNISAKRIGSSWHDEPSLQVSSLFPLVVSWLVLQGFTPTVSCWQSKQ
jgi:hypothetical protein